MPLSQTSQTLGLRNARFSPPAAPPTAVERAALVNRIEGSVAQFTLICAPAGFGKTTLMQQLREHFQVRGIAAFWLRVERADNDLGRFVGSLVGAAQASLGDLVTPVTHDDHLIVGDSAHGLEANLFDWLSLSETRVALFIDDLELIVDDEVWGFLQRLLANLDPRHRIVLASRATPRLALGKMRANGQLLELDQTHLRFTAAEAQAYLERLRIGAPAIRALQRQTEGWPAALQLAVVALRARGGRRSDAIVPVSAASAGVAEYLAQEVLDTRPPAQRNFLLRSSVLGDFCAELSDAALQRHDSEEILAEILRDNLPLSPIDAEQRWFRYHPLLADFLRGRLLREAKEEFRELHKRAAAWTADHGLMIEAVAHSLAAKDFTLAANLLAGSAMDNVRSGRVADTAQAIERLPDEEIYTRPALLRAAAFAAIFAHRYDAARRYMEIIERRNDMGDGDDDQIAAMRLMLFGWTDRVPELSQAADALRLKLSRFGPFTAGLASNTLAFCDMSLGRFAAAERHLAEARQACEPIEALYVLSYAACFAAAIELNLGNMSAARATLEGAMNRAIAAGQRYGSSGAVVATYLVELLYEANELDACQAFVDDYMPIVVETGMPDHVIVLHRIAARLHFLGGRGDAGQAIMIQLNDLGARRGLPRLCVTSWLERCYAALRRGDIEGARRAFANGSDKQLWESFGAFNLQANEIEDVLIASLRLQLATGQCDHALSQLRMALQTAEAAGRRRRALRLQILQAQALEGAGRHREATIAFDEAVTAASANGMVRVLVDDAWTTMTALVGRSMVSGEARGVDLLRELSAPHASPSTAVSASSERAGTALRLTTREAQILRLVWKGGTNKAIARDLFLTENTIETHLRRIYEKLGTRRRTQAAALAREAGAI